MQEKKGKAATRAKNKYNAQKYDNLRIVVPKGRKPEIMAVAEAAGDSLNGYITKAIDNYINAAEQIPPGICTIIGGIDRTGNSSFTIARKEQALDSGNIIDTVKKAKAQDFYVILHFIGQDITGHPLHNRWSLLTELLPLCDEAVFFDNDNGFIEVAKYIDFKLTLKVKGDSLPIWLFELMAFL